MGEKPMEDRLEVDQEVEKSFQRLVQYDQVNKGLEFLKEDHADTTKEQIELVEIPAPTFQESERASAYQEKLKKLGIENVHVDEVGNVFGVRRGSGNGPTLVVCAHLDTVFPEGTDVKARIVDGKVYAPGIGDDGRGLAAVLTIIRAFQSAKIETEGDIIFGATVGEEGLGDLRGVKALFQNRKDIDGFISIEPGDVQRITYIATGSKRYKVKFRGVGGHSFGHFGIPSPIHALGRAIADIAKIETPENPKTTYNVGLISGGTSINTIAETAEMFIDMRSNGQEELALLEEKVLKIITFATDEENKRTDDVNKQIVAEITLVGNRPAGSQQANSPIVQASVSAAQVLGFHPILSGASSTDSNIPISLGIPAVTLGGGGDSGGTHTLNEYYDPTDAYYGVQRIFLVILALVGLKNEVTPLLSKN